MAEENGKEKSYVPIPPWITEALNKGGIAAVIIVIWFIFLQPMKDDFNDIRKEVQGTSKSLSEVKHSLDKAIFVGEIGRKEIAKGVEILSKAVITKAEVRRIIETEYWGKDKADVYRRLKRLETKVGIE